MAWLTRLIVRDWSSCFFTHSHRLPLDDHGVASAPPVAMRNLAFDKRNQKRFNIIHNYTLSRPSKICNNNNNNTQLNKPMVKEKHGVSVGNRIDGSSWSLSLDKDYIVFCFEEDEAFGAVKDERSVKFEDLNRMHKNSRHLNSMVKKYGEGGKQVSNLNILLKRPNDSDEQDQNCINPNKEDDEKETVQASGQRLGDNIRMACQVEGIEDCGGMVAAESRNSDQSEGGRVSFAFPVLGWEWIGSPVQMPRSEDEHLKKQKTRNVGFQCCRF